MGTPHNIALFIDGTWNKPSATKPTNVYKLFRASCAEPTGMHPQVTYYLPGVGHDIRQHRVGAPAGWYGGPWSAPLPIRPELPRGLDAARWPLGGLFGAGTTARVKEAYALLCHHFIRDRGDRIYVFGFSRGAFAARSLAGFVFRVGTLLANKLHLVEAAYAVYESGIDPNDTLLAGFLQAAADVQMLQQADDPAALPLHFVGLWDTVAALGLPGRAALFTADRTEHHQTTPPLNVLAARHALALHEFRADFKPEVWDGRGHRNLEQVWFPGAHADVGGGCPLPESGLANDALDWMANEAMAFDLKVDTRVLREHYSANDRTLHNSISGLFRGFTPELRQALLKMHDPDESTSAMPRDVLYFHQSVGRYFLERSGQVPRRWPSKVVAEMTNVDEAGMRLYIRNFLLGDLPRGQT